MLTLFQITNDPALARRCDALAGLRLFVDLERLGKAERQAGRNTFISSHQMADVGRVKAQLRRAPLMVRTNPWHADSVAEIDAAIAHGADMLMQPMFTRADEVRSYCAAVAGRRPVVALLETAAALETLAQWVDTPGLAEVYVGLNDLHLSLGLRFMFEPLALGLVDRVATLAKAHGRGFGFGGIARLKEGLLPGVDVLAEHVRLGSQAVILSRTFHRSDDPRSLEEVVEELRAAERAAAQRTAPEVEADRVRVHAAIRRIAQDMAVPGRPA